MSGLVHQPPDFDYEEHNRWREARRQRLAIQGTAILSLPNLVEVSGDSELFTACSQELQQWHEVVYERPPRHPATAYYAADTPLKRWTKQ